MDESAGKRRSRRLRKGAPWLKTVLVQCAWSAIRKHDSYLSAQYYRIRNRRGPKKAIVVVAASILTAMYYILRDMVPYRDLGAHHFDTLNEHRLVAQLQRHLARRTSSWRSSLKLARGELLRRAQGPDQGAEATAPTTEEHIEHHRREMLEIFRSISHEHAVLDRPAAEIGNDLAFALDLRNHLVFAVVDVTGSGTPGALSSLFAASAMAGQLSLQQAGVVWPHEMIRATELVGLRVELAGVDLEVLVADALDDAVASLKVGQ